MTLTDLVTNPAFPRALVIGVFGGAGLSLTTLYSRRGPMIYPVYAAILTALTLLLARYPEMTFASRFSATLAGFLVASAALYITASVHADQERKRGVADGRLPASASQRRISVGGHAWRFGFLALVGSLASAGVAFVAA